MLDEEHQSLSVEVQTINMKLKNRAKTQQKLKKEIFSSKEDLETLKFQVKQKKRKIAASNHSLKAMEAEIDMKKEQLKRSMVDREDEEPNSIENDLGYGKGGGIVNSS